MDSGANIYWIWHMKRSSDYNEVKDQSLKISKEKSPIKGEGNAFIDNSGNCINISAEHVTSFNQSKVSNNSIFNRLSVTFEDTETS